MKGFAYFKQEVARRIDFDPAVLPYNQAMIAYIKSQKEIGRKVLLVTASDQRIADKIIHYLGIFDGAIGSDGNRSYGGHEKRKKLAEEFGELNYDYAGNSNVDLKVWPGSHEVVIVTNDQRLLDKVKQLHKPIKHFPSLINTWVDYCRFFRVLRWRRNILIFAPLIIAREFHWAVWQMYIAPFFIFCLCSSSAGIFSDLFDLFSDRRHAKKKKRPIAAGKISARKAAIIAGVLFIASVLLGLFYTVYFSETIIYYFIFSLIYIFFLKKNFILRMIGMIVISLMPLIAGGVLRFNL